MERMPQFEQGEKEENLVKEALESAGLYEVESPRVGTKAYDSVMELAKQYIETIKMADTMSRSKEKEFSPVNLGTLDIEREKLHDRLCMKLQGKHKTELDLRERQEVTNFAAHLMGAEEFVIRGGKFQSQTAYFHDSKEEI